MMAARKDFDPRRRFPDSRLRWIVPVVVGALLAGTVTTAAWATTARLDLTDPGSAFDGIVDGFPGIAPLDGIADVGGNALGVALKADVTEEHAVVEFSLAKLTGVAAPAISSAILTFNIDDVLGTFGPGTDFDGTAAERISVRSYSGDGVAELDDFARGQPAGEVTPGRITDETLASSGPVRFELDVTDALRSVLAQGASHLGLVLLTDDSPTGTSLDDLGPGSSGPPGIDGAALPFIVVEYAGGNPTPTATPRENRPTPTPVPPPTPMPSIDPALGPIGRKPLGLGDQLLYYWDGRAGFTTFLTVRNLADDPLTVELQVYGPEFGEPFVDTVSIAARAATIFDVQELARRGLETGFGLAVAHAVGPSGEPLVSRALAGSFTVANLATNSAWGATAPARIAIEFGPEAISLPPRGRVIDGETTLFRTLRPEELVLPLYFDPDTLDPVDLAGNQIVGLSFNDEPGVPFRATARATTWSITAHRADGTSLPVAEWTSSGVSMSDLVAILGEDARGSAGSAILRARPGGAYNRLILFTQSLAAFGTGALLPETAFE